MSKNLIIYAKPSTESENFIFVTFNLSTGQQEFRYYYDVKDLLKFFYSPPEIIKTSVKGIVFDIDGFCKYGTMNHEFCQKLSANLIALKIPFRFMSNLHINAMCSLIGGKIDREKDKEILQIYVQNDTFKIFSLSRSKNGYLLKEIREIPETYDPKILLGSTNPTKIVISHSTPFLKAEKFDKLQSVFAGKNTLVSLRFNVWKFMFDAIKEIVENMHNVESSKKYFVIPQSLEEFGVTAFGKGENEILFKIEKDEYLPAEESCVVPRFYKKFCITRKPESKQVILHCSQDAHRFKLTLSIDLNNIPTLSYDAVILSRVKNMPKRLKIDKSEKFPIIGLFDNASVICLWNEKDKCYKFMDSWNGKFGKDLFLDFLLPKPAIVCSSTDVVSLTGAVYDLIKIMSMPPDTITIHPDWKFTITKDVDNPVLLEFDVFEDSRKQASPAFLMAIMLKEHLKAIKKETGKRPTKLGFRLLDEFESPDARKRVEAGLKEACEMIKIEFLLL